MNRSATHTTPATGAARYADLNVAILGFARQGAAAARFFLAHGADVTVSDLRSEATLAAAISDLVNAASQTPAGPGALHFALGGHPLELLQDANLLCLSGGVSPAIPIVQEAVRRGIPLTNDALLTLHHCPVPIIGVTGSAGKTTTTTLVGLILEAAGFTVHVGGNIGVPLLDRLDAIRAGDKAVLELSSFQLELFDASPDIAAVLNITPNHLDRHPSMSHYAAAKAHILQYQAPGDTCVLNADDPYTGPWLRAGRCQITEGAGQPAVYFPLQAGRVGFSLAGPVSHGAYLANGALFWQQPGLPPELICRATDLQLRGRHNIANVLAAACLAGAAGADPQAMAQVATTFGGVAHRLEVVRQHNNITWVNDSIATAPERTVAALRAFDEPIVLLLGGRDKNLPWDQCAVEIKAGNRVRSVVLFGEAAPIIRAALEHHPAGSGATPVPVVVCADLQEAVYAADAAARPGDVVLLAPGGTSFDAYTDFEARGNHFRALVEALP